MGGPRGPLLPTRSFLGCLSLGPTTSHWGALGSFGTCRVHLCSCRCLSTGSHSLSLPFLPAPPLLFFPPLHILTHLTQTFDNFVGFFLSKMAPYRTAEILNLPWYKWYISSTSLLLVRLIYITILFQISLSVFIILFTCFNVGLF